MSAAGRYAVSGVSAVALLTIAAWPFLDGAGRKGVLIAGAIALPVQIAAFSVLVRFRGKLNGFTAAWAGGMVARTLVVAIVALFVVRSGTASAAPMLLALAGFFFGLLLLEPVHFGAEREEIV